MSLHESSGRLHPTPPFDFAQSLNFVSEFPPTSGEQTVNTHSLTKALSVNGHIILFELKSTGAIEQPELAYTLYSTQPLNEETQRAAIDRIEFALSLGDDLKPFYAIGRRDPDFAPVIDQLYGLHQVKFLTPFESAGWAILSQRTSMAAAHKSKQSLMEKYGGSLSLNGGTYWAFPEPAQLAGAPEGELSALVKNARRAAYLREASWAFNQVDDAFLRSGDYDEVRNWLLKIKGIGAWSADLILLRGLGRMRQLHIESGSIFEQRMSEAASKVYGGVLKAADIQAIAARYGEWQGYWAYYLRTAA